MNTNKINDKEIIKLIQYGLDEHQINPIHIRENAIQTILYNYEGYCCEEKRRINKELDTFIKAACLLVAINKAVLTNDRIINASVAISCATKMCEKAYVRDNQYNTLIKLEEFDIKIAYENENELYNYWTKTMFEKLIIGKESIEDYSKDFKTFHEVTTRICENQKIKKRK